MSSAARPRHVYPCRPVAVALMGVLGMLLQGCSGTTRSSGSPGAAGPTGPTGPITGAATLNVSSATAIAGKITAVAINSNDWALSSVGPATVPNLLALGVQPYRDNANVFGLTMRNQFGGDDTPTAKSQ